MAPVLRCLLLAAGILGLTPGAASAAATVELNQVIGVLEITGDPAPDDITTVQTASFVIVSGNNNTVLTPVAPCTGNATTVSCPVANVRMIAADLGAGIDHFDSVAVAFPQSIAGGNDNDVLKGGGGGDVLAGGNGDDTLDGGGGIDDYFGEAGADTIKANDGIAERIACGAGTDTVTNDFTDIIAECERGADGDNDSFASTVDCNDANRAIHPGAPEVFGNGVDEDCNGRDDVNRDVDGDGFAVPTDCDDGNAAIRPGALEIRGNAVDENCDRRAESWRVVPALVTNRWAVAKGFTRLQTLVVRVAPKGAAVTLSCRGGSCPFKRAQRRTVPRDLASVSFSRLFRDKRLRSGTRLTLRITAEQSISRTFTYTVRRDALPDARIECRAPGASKGDPC